MFFLFHVICLFAGICAEEPHVTTKYGSIQGFRYERKDGGESDVFLGIPFAKPPVGELRFEKPVPPDPWPETLIGHKYGATCHPHNRSVTIQTASEDCLTLNIVRPQITKESEALPVLIWVHGGGYEIGSASIYPYQGLANIYNQHDIIVVSIQYRLGFLGFFSDGTSMLGNLGSWDQAEAIKFVKENIADFGGDPEQITIWGLSAGGGSTSQLTLSPKVNDLFSQSISMSGSAFSNWAFSDATVDHSIDLAEAVGCEIGANLKQCLKGKTIGELHDGVEKIGGTHYSVNLLKWSPRIDGDFYPSHPEEMVKAAPKITNILGVSLKESLFFTILGLTKAIHKLEVLPENFGKYSREDFEEAVKALVAKPEFYGSNSQKTFDLVVEEYAGSEATGEKDSQFYLEQYSKILTDVMFNVAVVREALTKLERGHTVYLYITEHFNEAIYSEQHPVKGATHVCEYPYILDIYVLGKFSIEDDETERRITKTFRESFVNFVKTGEPINSISPWPPIDTAHPLQYLHINSHPHMRQGMLQKELNFWNQTALLGYDMITMRKTTEKKGGDRNEL